MNATEPGAVSAPARPVSGQQRGSALPPRGRGRSFRAAGTGRRRPPRSPPTCPSQRGHPEERDVRVHRDANASARGLAVRSRRARGRRRRAAPRPPASGRASPGTRPEAGLVASELPRPDECVGDRAPRGQRPPDVPEHDRERGDAEPEDHVDPGRREVAERVGVAEEGRDPDEAEQHDGERLHDDPQRAEDHTREPRGQPAAMLPGGQERRPPQDAEQDEGDDQHRGRPPVEHPRRDGRSWIPPMPCATRPKLLRPTSRTARTESGWCSSSSKRPGRSTVSGMRTGFPGVSGFSMS